ncbi:ROK family transcriptional regulator [Micrococcales bacterium 31B]|nr:ROK family transcriptional regulator [Micrococcales bacterium 31B]
MTDIAEPSRIESSILEYLVSEGASTRVAIQQYLQVSRPTMSSAVMRLMNRGLIEESGTAEYGAGRNGRPRALLSIRQEVGAVIGIELGRARVAVTALSIDGTVSGQRIQAVSEGDSLQSKLDMAVSWLIDWAEAGSLRRSALLGVGLALAGRHMPVDAARSSVDPEGVDLGDLRQLANAPVLWDNNTRLAAIRHLSEFTPDALARGLLYVVLSSGISAGLVDARGIYRGGNGSAGEVGHVSIDLNGPQCWCGARGCLEAICGQTAVLDRARAAGCDVKTIADLSALINAGHSAAITVTQETGRRLGIGLTAASMLCDPGSIVLSGPVTALGHNLVESARAELARRRVATRLPVANLTAAEGSEFDASHGAALSALQRWGVQFALRHSIAS